MKQKDTMLKDAEMYLQNQKREKSLVETSNILIAMAELFQAVEIDMNEFQEEFYKAWKLMKSGSDKELLQLMGFRIEKSDNEYKIKRYKKPTDFGELLSLNVEKFQIRAAEIANHLKDYEAEKQKEIDQMYRQNKESFRQLEAYKAEQLKQRNSQTIQSEDYYISMQQVLSNIDLSYEKNEIVYELLKDQLLDQGIEVLWDSNADQVKHYFSVQNVSFLRDGLLCRPSQASNRHYVVRPCLVQGDTVLQKGLVYQLLEAQ